MKRNLALVLLLATACGDAGADVRPPTGADAVVLRVDAASNSSEPLDVATAYPTFTLYGDGRLVAEDPTQEGALPPLVEARVSPEGVRLLVDEAVRRGLLEPLDDYGTPAILHGSGRTFELDVGTEQRRVGVYGLGEELADDPGLTEEQYEACQELRELASVLRDWQSFLGADVVEGPTPYLGEALLVMGYPVQGVSASTFPIDLAATGTEYGARTGQVWCQQITGAAYEELLPLLAAGQRYGHWQVGDSRWRIDFRQVFPGEPGCEIVPQQ